MKSLIILLTILLSLQFNSQNTYSLWQLPVSQVPKYSYFKDIEKIFDPYIGEWEGEFDGKKVIIIVNKEEKVLDKEDLVYRDIVIIRYKVKDRKGKIIENTLEKVFNNKRFKIEMLGIREDINKLMGIFYGGVCGLGRGFVYLGEPKNNQMTWTYFSDTILITDDMIDKCQGEVNLPQGEDLIFTKQ